MARAVIAVIASFFAIGIMVSLGVFAGFRVLGPDRAFEPARYDPTVLWCAVMLGVGFVAALIGGRLCAAFAGVEPARVLAGIVLALGFGFAVNNLRLEPTDAVRTAASTAADFKEHARQPAWWAFTNPVVGFLGVLVGAGKKKRKPAS